MTTPPEDTPEGIIIRMRKLITELTPAAEAGSLAAISIIHGAEDLIDRILNETVTRILSA